MESWLTSWILSLFFLGLLTQLEASHFRGGVITWRPTGTPNQIDIQYRLSWRRSSGYPCTDSSIRDPMLIGSGSLRCNQCSYTHICDLKFYCTDYSVPEDWTTGVNTFTYDVERPIFDMRFSSCCWITIQNGGGGVDWSIEAHVDLTPRADNGLINSSPVTAMTPILRAQYGCSYTINIPTSDPDNDDVRCRWPSNYYEKGDMYLPPMNMVLSQDCTITYQATGTGWWGVAVILEDFISSSSMDPLSKIPLQFLIHVTHGSGSCSSKPTFVDPTPNDGSSRDMVYGELFRTVLRTRSSSQSVPVTYIDTISPQGMTKSSLQQVFNSPTEFFVTVEWTPLAWQRGPNVFCFTAIDLNGYTSDQRCMTLHVWEPEVTTAEDVTLDITAMSTTIDITDQATTVESTTVNEVTTSVDCDSVLTSAPGTVSSPNYPGNYPNHATCNTLITASNGLKVVVTFKTFRLENCCDYLSIYDGDGPEDRLIGRFLGTDLPPGTSITSTEADLFMVFTTDYSVTYSGYEADYRFACDSVWLSAPGIISSPNYPGNYPNSVTCNTRITASNEQRVVLAFEAFNLESGYDYLRIYDGDGPEDRFIGSYSGTNMPPPITSSGKDLFLVFTTDGSVIRSGYEAEYIFENDMITTDLTTIMITKESTTEDLATTESAEGTTTEGYHPVRLVDGITDDEGRVEIFYQGRWGTVCDDYGFWGNQEASVVCRQLGYPEGYYQGVTESSYGEGDAGVPIWLSQVQCTGNEDNIEECDHAGLGVDYCGYHYYDVGVMCYDCNNTLTSPGSVSSPNFPGRYPNHVGCTTLITAYPGMRVVLTFSTFTLEYCYNCGCDSLSIYDADGDESNSLIGKYCGYNLPSPIISSGSYLFLEFRSDSSVNDIGFDADFIFIDGIRTTDVTTIWTTTESTTKDIASTAEGTTTEEEIRTTEGHTTRAESSTAAESTTVEKTTTANCDAILTSAPGTVTSPNYPGNYPNGVTCNILIIADDRQKVVLTFKSFHLESCCDFLSIYDGDGPEDRLIGRFTGTTAPYSITSTGRDLFLIFTTDGSVTYGGFYAEYRFEYEIRTTDQPILTTTKATTTDAVTTDESTTAGETTTSAREPTTFEPLTTALHPTDNPASSVICADNSMNVYIPRSIIGDVDADHLHFIDKACVGTSHNATHARVTTSFDQCGTIMEVRGDYVVFANIVIDDALPVTPGNEITRERDLEIPVECRMERDGFGSINFNPDSSKIVIEEEGYGKFSFELHLYPDNAYNSPFPPEAYPVNVKLRDMLHFEAQVMAETGLELFVETCAATTTTNPYSSPQYRFLDDGCIQDNTLQFYPSSDPMIQRFGLEAFAFVDSKTPVYVHCFLMVCNTTNPTSRCALGCQPSISKRDVSSHEGSKSYVMTEGPLRFLKEHKTQAFDNLDDNTSDIASVQQLGLFIASAVFMTLCFTVMIGVIIRSRRNPVPKGYTLLTNKHE